MDRAEAHPPDAVASLPDFAVTLPIYEASTSDPDLPAELLLPDWPGDQIAPVIGRAFRFFGPMIGDYVAQLTGGGAPGQAW